ncbi:DUF5753 domain-containing protein [Actinomadura verrucosospora]|uniref:XRE family transcriptional regulator n=1 Tax=Actinomadura verrucosospora TaxID=46165 RepID=A0A7D3VY75_ACTVE|nr:DUF5753 domain-containing protein [Actinomadura verrucosospora]QKG21692.1 XRE family transcriptional regulator [Actinomadura verrucosospora]
MDADDSYGATIAKRRLAALLAALRAGRGLTAAQVCARLDWGRGKLGRFEMNRWKRPELSDIRDLLRLYEVDGRTRERVVRLAVLARRRAWWRDYGDVFGTEYPGFENDARRIEVYAPLAVPPLLQTPAYAAAHASRLSRSAAWSARMVQATLNRQRILCRAGRSAPRVTAVVTEAALLYRWGGPGDRRAQLCRLIELAGRPNVEVRLHAFEAGPHPAPPAPLCRLLFTADDPALLFVDAGHATALVADPGEAAAQAADLAATLAGACSPEETLLRLTEMINSVD